MELKKTKKADIERYRVVSFLAGIVIAVSVLFVVLYISYEDGDTAYDEEHGTVEETDITPVFENQNMIALQEVGREEAKSDIVVAADEANEPVEESSMVDGSDNGIETNEEKFSDDTPQSAVSQLAADADNPQNFRVVEDLPQFPGGPVEMMKWLTKNLKYPDNARQRKKEGRVVAQFTINVDGSVSDIKIIKSIDIMLDREALRVLRMMPTWKPGMMEGKPCKTRVVVPVWFRL